jgi:hypothetical protein
MVRRSLTLSLTICAALGLPMWPAAAQQTGGILKFFHRDSPASMSIHEEATISTVAPMMGVFNNLVLFKQNEKQNRPEFIQLELAAPGIDSRNQQKSVRLSPSYYTSSRMFSLFYVRLGGHRHLAAVAQREAEIGRNVGLNHPWRRVTNGFEFIAGSRYRWNTTSSISRTRLPAGITFLTRPRILTSAWIPFAT